VEAGASSNSIFAEWCEGLRGWDESIVRRPARIPSSAAAFGGGHFQRTTPGDLGLAA